LNKESALEWVEFMPDKAIDKVSEPQDAGLCGIRVAIHDMREGPYDWSKGVWGQRISKYPDTFNCRAYIYQCRDLPAADENGTSDPFVVIHDSTKEKRTSVI
jgi:hypothetical protein